MDIVEQRSKELQLGTHEFVSGDDEPDGLICKHCQQFRYDFIHWTI